MMKRITFSRRNVLQISLSLSGLLVLNSVRKFLGYQEPAVQTSQWTLDVPEAYAPGSVTAVPGGHGWIVRDAGGLYAVTAVCTHLGCLVNHEADAFTCPCHGSRFRVDGSVLHGPALQALPHVALSRTAEGLLRVDLTQQVAATERLAVG
ncbi:MAG: Rieske 2Fe-2S domain-containing protein [Chloroflexota bacterium]|nr:Rieske 2Fe-2S domain-containing protein [Ardenticatenaceae bacterium]